MTGPEHYLESERLGMQAEQWMDADMGWKASLSTEERIARRTADLLAAQCHATLALAAATAIQPSGYGMNRAEAKAWTAAASTPEPSDRD